MSAPNSSSKSQWLENFGRVGVFVKGQMCPTNSANDEETTTSNPINGGSAVDSYTDDTPQRSRGRSTSSGCTLGRIQKGFKMLGELISGACSFLALLVLIGHVRQLYKEGAVIGDVTSGTPTFMPTFAPTYLEPSLPTQPPSSSSSIVFFTREQLTWFAVIYYLGIWLLAEGLHLFSVLVQITISICGCQHKDGIPYRKLWISKFITIFHYFFVLVGTAGFVAEWLAPADESYGSDSRVVRLRGLLMGGQIFLVFISIAMMTAWSHLHRKLSKSVSCWAYLLSFLLLPLLIIGYCELLVFFFIAVGIMTGSLGLFYFCAKCVKPKLVEALEKMRFAAYNDMNACSAVFALLFDTAALAVYGVLTICCPWLALVTYLWYCCCGKRQESEKKKCFPLPPLSGKAEYYWTGICFDGLVFCGCIVLLVGVVVYPAIAVALQYEVRPESLKSVIASITGNGAFLMTVWLISKLTSLFLGILYPVLMITAHCYWSKLSKALDKYADYEIAQVQLFFEVLRLHAEEKDLAWRQGELNKIERSIRPHQNDSGWRDVQRLLEEVRGRISNIQSNIATHKLIYIELLKAVERMKEDLEVDMQEIAAFIFDYETDAKGMARKYSKDVGIGMSDFVK